MQDIPDLKYKLVLFVGGEQIELERKDNRTWAPVQHPYVLRRPTSYSHRSLCVYRDISPTSNLRVENFFFFFFGRLDGSAAVGFHEDRVNSVPKAVTLTNNPCSLELSSGHTEESMLLPPLLLEHQDCRRDHQVSIARYVETPRGLNRRILDQPCRDQLPQIGVQTEGTGW